MIEQGTNRPAGLAIHCPLITDILRGRAAAALKDRLDEQPTEGILHVNEAWWWTQIDTPLGTKTGNSNSRARGADIPIRLDYEEGLVHTGDAPATFHAKGHGIDLTGPTPTWASEPHPYPSLDYLGLLLDTLIDTGSNAEWQWRSELETYARRRAHITASAISKELSTFHGSDTYYVVDEQTIEEVVADVMFGSEDHTSSVASMLNRLDQPSTFANVEPVRWASVWLKRDIRTRMHARLGDPRDGAHIRAAAIAIGSKNPRQVAEHYNLTATRPIHNWDDPTGRCLRALNFGLESTQKRVDAQ